VEVVSVENAPAVPLNGQDKSQVLLLHDRVLGRRLMLHAGLRYLLIVTLVAGTLFGKYVAGIVDLEIGYCLWLAAVMTVINTIVLIAVRAIHPENAPGRSHRILAGLMHFTIAFDFVCLTFLLWVVGGAQSPLKAFYLVHVFLASVLVSPRAAYGHALFGFALLAGLVLGQYYDVIPMLLPVGAVNSDMPLNGQYVMTVLTVQALLFMLSAFLVGGLTHLLRSNEIQLNETTQELRDLSEMRQAFLHTALHDLKAPAVAISMMLHNLNSGIGGPLNEQQTKWLDRCQARLNDLSSFLHDFQVLAAVETTTMEKEGKGFDIAPVLERVVNENRELADAQRQTLTVAAPDSLPPVCGIERLIHESVANLVTNAIKYTPEGGRIEVRGLETARSVIIEVEDNGYGIAPEDQAAVFHEFVRAPEHREGLKAIKGSGLGLSIVKSIVKLHNGEIRLTSAVDKGSTFTIEFPICERARASGGASCHEHHHV
jgi:signal transduction histidine kinase